MGTKQQIHFIGGGQMSEAIIRAILQNETFSAKQISVADINPSRLDYLKGKYEIKTVSSHHQQKELSHATLIVLGVRPHDDLASVGELIKEHGQDEAAVLSLIAGVNIEKLASYLQVDIEGRPIIRVIPNTLTDTGLGYSGVATNQAAEVETVKEEVDKFLKGFGKVQYLEESLIDVFTGFGVAGPNYIYYFIESFVDAGVLAGLPREQAWKVALENMVGAVEMLRLSGKHPRQLLDINNSPAGVGMHALHELNGSDFSAGLQRSVLAAVKRTTELGGEKS
ncbi:MULTISPECIES: pyrroline-5-carboxylate reductase family protein [Bacillaceae]|uniref:Pyrroline-5-carboxylate reductase n=1 Tax=Evansella alkalicola TaxID=745819 RepID=A0ABS6JSN8_9BACI|nr:MULTISPECIES: pyrroline-5-carboxylate reductase dimerization domain-containing protein [Bacillaceae]MBU9721584.1 NAD(P)-binding domain-containing protein [Bacillus alkalicola]